MELDKTLRYPFSTAAIIAVLKRVASECRIDILTATSTARTISFLCRSAFGCLRLNPSASALLRCAALKAPALLETLPATRRIAAFAKQLANTSMGLHEQYLADEVSPIASLNVASSFASLTETESEVVQHSG